MELTGLEGRPCAAHGNPIKVRKIAGAWRAVCMGPGGGGHCDTAVLTAYALSLNGQARPAANGAAEPVCGAAQAIPEAQDAPVGRTEASAENENENGFRAESSNGNGAGQARSELVRRPTLTEWQLQLFTTAYKCLTSHPGYRDKRVPAVTLLEPLMADLRIGVQALSALGVVAPAALSRGDIEEEVEKAARDAIEAWTNTLIWSAPKPLNGNGQVPATVAARKSSLIVENQEQAAIANAEYLARPEVIERLGYSQSIALMIGGKHHGKTTNVRTLALSIIRGLPIWGRATAQGAVVYAASDDEVASSRNELLRMGWNSRREPLHFARIDSQSDATPEQVLEDIAELALTSGAVLIILDMLFDFVGIRDELSYAGTRQAIGQVQRLADNTKALVVGSHHTPKYLTDTHTAANAALGSQGVSARFSPIILTRKWAEGLFTVESTMTRDPRGAALNPMRIRKNAEGWIETGEEFKEWMKWEIWSERVMAFFEGGERTQGHSVYEIAEKLELDRSRVQNVLYQLTQLQQPKLIREKRGRGYKYYLADVDMFEREGGNFSEE